ncbi:MAG: hypothetical protein JWO73_564 [Candidatus Taylorbacteria bacterium]|nr:hypothetical protein [Candidatus Taylorbacteria bacterium]
MNLPKNAPKWAQQSMLGPETEGIPRLGQWVTVEKYADFIVVRLMSGKRRAGKPTGESLLIRTFATRDEIGNHSDEFKIIDQERIKTAEIAGYEPLGLNDEEAERLFFLRRGRTPLEKILLSRGRAVFRSVKPEVFKEIVRALDDEYRVQVCAKNNLVQILKGLKMPDLIMFVKVAAWVFHGMQLPGYRKSPKWKSTGGRRHRTNTPPSLRVNPQFPNSIAA